MRDALILAATGLSLTIFTIALFLLALSLIDHLHHSGKS